MDDLTRRSALKVSAGATVVGIASLTMGRSDSVSQAATQQNDNTAKLQPKFTEVMLDEQSIKPKDKDTKATPFEVKLVNKSDWKCTHTKVNNGAFYQVIPAIGRTALASQTCKQAIDSGKYETAQSRVCEDGTFSIVFRFEKGNQIGETNPVTVNPDCDYAGTVICFNLDGN